MCTKVYTLVQCTVSVVFNHIVLWAFTGHCRKCTPRCKPLKVLPPPNVLTLSPALTLSSPFAPISVQGTGNLLIVIREAKSNIDLYYGEISIDIVINEFTFNFVLNFDA